LKILFVHDLVFRKRESGRISCNGGLTPLYFDRFFDASYDHVEILSRVCATGDKGVDFDTSVFSISSGSVSSYANLLSVRRFFEILRGLKAADLVVLSTPSVIGSYCAVVCFLFGVRYVVEVAGDDDAFASKRGGRLVTAILKILMPHFVRRAIGAAYVSEFLLCKFPNPKHVVASNVNINSIRVPRTIASSLSASRRFVIGFVGALTHRKGVDTIIDAADRLILTEGFKNLKFIIIGSHAESDWEAVVHARGLDDYFEFRGSQPQEKVLDFMDSMDLYIQPSRSEGLARSTIEAMSRGLPVIATNLPGFIELLPEFVLVQVGSADDLAAKIVSLSNRDTLQKCSELNRKRAGEYLYSELHAQRVMFYKGFGDENSNSPVG